jgi:hypothetical protein
MSKRHWAGFGLLLGGLAVLHLLAAPVSSQPPPERIAAPAKIHPKMTLEELAKTIQTDLANGKSVDVPGLGTFRVVRVMPHRQNIDGRAVMVYKNVVQLQPTGELEAVANSPGARPQDTVLTNDYFYQDLPYGGAAIDRIREHSIGGARNSNPTNKPSQKVGGGRRP